MNSAPCVLLLFFCQSWTTCSRFTRMNKFLSTKVSIVFTFFNSWIRNLWSKVKHTLHQCNTLRHLCHRLPSIWYVCRSHSFLRSWLISRFLTLMRMPPMKKELKSLPEHLSLFHLKWDSFYAIFILPCSVSSIIVCLFLIGHCIVCASLIYDFWLLLWYLQTFIHSPLFSCHILHAHMTDKVKSLLLKEQRKISLWMGSTTLMKQKQNKITRDRTSSHNKVYIPITEYEKNKNLKLWLA